MKHWLLILDPHGLSIYFSHPATSTSLFYLRTIYNLNICVTASNIFITSLMAGLYACLQELILQWKLLLRMSKWTIKLAKTILNLPWIFPQHNKLSLKSFKLTYFTPRQMLCIYQLTSAIFILSLLIILPPLAMWQPPVAINLASGLKRNYLHLKSLKFNVSLYILDVLVLPKLGW